MNDLDLRLEVISRSCQPLREIRRWISRKPLEIEAWFQMEMAWAIKLSNGYVTDDVMWPPKVLWGSTIGHPSDSLASCLFAQLAGPVCAIFNASVRQGTVPSRWKRLPSYLCPRVTLQCPSSDPVRFTADFVNRHSCQDTSVIYRYVDPWACWQDVGQAPVWCSCCETVVMINIFVSKLSCLWWKCI